MNLRIPFSATTRRLVLILLISAIPLQGVLGSELEDVDERSFKLGGVHSWAEAVGAGVKELALSSPGSPDEIDLIADDIESIAARYGVSVYREKELLLTDLFPASVTKGKHVVLMYKNSTLERYLALKERKAELVKASAYAGLERENIARQFGHLLSYADSDIDKMLKKAGRAVLKPAYIPPSLEGVWKSPTLSLDDPRWKIEDAACLNGCSLASYNYLNDLLSDPANDDTSLIELHGNAAAFKKRQVSMISRPATQRDLETYDAANDVALNCTPEGDGLQHQITAPPVIEIEQLEDRVIIRYEYWNAVRTVYLDPRDVPVGTAPSRLGISTGRYDGQTLVIETDNLLSSQISLGGGHIGVAKKDALPSSQNQRAGGKFSLSDDSKYVERYTLGGDNDRLDVEWTVIDPINFREPYTGKVVLLDAPDWELGRFDCDAITGEF